MHSREAHAKLKRVTFVLVRHNLVTLRHQCARTFFSRQSRDDKSAHRAIQNGLRERRGRFETFVAEIVERLTTCLQGALVAVLEENILDLFSNRQ